MSIPATLIGRATGLDYDGTPIGPNYFLCKGYIYNLDVDAVVVNTNERMQKDRQEGSGRRGANWINGTVPVGQALNTSTTVQWNEANYNENTKIELKPGKVLLTPGGIRSHQPTVVMVNLIKSAPHNTGTNFTLGNAYERCLDELKDMINDCPFIDQPTRLRVETPASIAFPLLGCRDGYGIENSAKIGLKAIKEYFLSWAGGPTRRAIIGNVYLVVPEKEVDGIDPNAVEDAWRKAWGCILLSVLLISTNGRLTLI